MALSFVPILRHQQSPIWQALLLPVAGILYTAMGIEPIMFTPIFAVSRVVGWAARCLEYLKENRIFRPRAVYVGELHADYVAIEKR